MVPKYSLPMEDPDLKSSSRSSGTSNSNAQNDNNGDVGTAGQTLDFITDP